MKDPWQENKGASSSSGQKKRVRIESNRSYLSGTYSNASNVSNNIDNEPEVYSLATNIFVPDSNGLSKMQQYSVYNALFWLKLKQKWINYRRSKDSLIDLGYEFLQES